MKTISQNITILIFLISIFSCENKDDKAGITVYKLNNKEYVCPLKPGYESEYKITAKIDGSSITGYSKQSCTQTNIKNPLNDNKILVALENTITLISGNEKTSTKSIFYYEIATDGIYLHGLFDSKNDFYWVNEGIPEKLDFNYFIGATISNSYTIDGLKDDVWPNDTIWYNLDNKSENMSILEIEPTICSLGSFECYKLSKSSTSLYLNEQETSWNYPNIGVIKRKVVSLGMGLSIEYNYELTKTNVPLE